MKRLVSVILALVLCAVLALPALAYDDMTYTQDVTISDFSLKYNNVTVKSGVTVTIMEMQPDPRTIEISGRLTVESGGRIEGGSLLFRNGASYEGIDLYYRAEGEEKLLAPEHLQDMMDDLPDNEADRFRSFNWVSATGHYVMPGEGYTVDPFFDNELVEDVVFDRDADLTGKRTHKWGSAVIKSGVTVILGSSFGAKSVTGSLAVEPGGVLKGGRLEIFNGVTVSGMQLYYTVDGERRELPGNDLNILFGENTDPDNRIRFDYDDGAGCYVAQGDHGSGGHAGDHFIDVRDNEKLREETALAEKLKTLGLFRGVGTNADGSTDFDLHRAPTRAEEVVMLIRMLGREREALEGDWTHPFDDVPAWADKYVGYAYENGLTNGIGGGKFGTAVPATAQMFSTFCLRAMGYSDADGDFDYSGANEFAMERGILRGQVDIDAFDRGVCVAMMESALRQSMKDGKRLWEKLADEGVFTREQYLGVFG